MLMMVSQLVAGFHWQLVMSCYVD
ncbi:CLUMA_CG000943, isoform A [Clunio marinus]|uniref:CLUMA_CG000943, isoform A n=1 Tax=Clunio marinus TaxID=568069 RepID=A0A1J1HKZ9_9DIPT|nr:CLUMA_CG000943, isoform A [Clunio marinus]